VIVRDPHRFVNELDESAIDRLIARLESRAKDAAFTGLLDKYAAQLDLPASAQVLEVGCGTGATARFLARRKDFAGRVLGVDHSPRFIEAANKIAREEGVSGRVEFRVCDAHRLDFPAATFDAVIAHTLISHVSEPTAVLSEMARVVRPGGTVVVFDGDYASMTYAFPDHEFGHQMDTALVTVAFNNPRVMRELPRLMPALDLTLKAAWGDAMVEIGDGSFFKSFAETYAPYVTKAGFFAAGVVEHWLAVQRQSMEDGTFFAACNYYTYLAGRAQ